MDNNEKQTTKVSFKNGIHVHEGRKDVDVSIKHGVHVRSDEELVEVSRDGIHIENEKDSIHMDRGEMHQYAQNQIKKHTGRIIFSVALLAVAGIVYLLLGKFYGNPGWSYGWMVFLLALIGDSVFSAVKNRKPSEFAYVLFVVFIYLLLGFFKSLWHPGWIIFLTIPIYYIICDKIEKSKQK